ncbi:MAG: 6-phosphogluconolactonase [Gaiellaceae bacterium]|nr:6-phosphogluconolactonase [Gaiellaceae bacterium]
MTGVELVVVDDAQAVAAAVADRLVAAARAGGHIALTGGTTPEQAYKNASRLEPDWGNVELWWSDERCVPPDDDLSNYALAKRTLLDNLEHGPKNVHRIKGELGKAAAAEDYAQELGDLAFDFELLGMGKDGHVASLFPNAPTLSQPGRVLPAEPGLDPFVDRVTLSIPALNSARTILFALAGADKADAAYRAFGAAPSRQTPASLVRATTAILDRAAAAKLSP